MKINNFYGFEELNDDFSDLKRVVMRDNDGGPYLKG